MSSRVARALSCIESAGLDVRVTSTSPVSADGYVPSEDGDSYLRVLVNCAKQKEGILLLYPAALANEVVPIFKGSLDRALSIDLREPKLSSKIKEAIGRVDCDVQFIASSMLNELSRDMDYWNLVVASADRLDDDAIVSWYYGEMSIAGGSWSDGKEARFVSMFPFPDIFLIALVAYADLLRSAPLHSSLRRVRSRLSSSLSRFD